MKLQNANNLEYIKERVSFTLYARFNPFATIARVFVERNKVIQKPKTPTKPPFEKKKTSFKTVLIKFTTSVGTILCIK